MSRTDEVWAELQRAVDENEALRAEIGRLRRRVGELQEHLNRKQAVLDAICRDCCHEAGETQGEPDDGCGTGSVVR